MTQIYELVNDAIKESIGDQAQLNEDLGNLVDVGKAVLGSPYTLPLYAKNLINRIGREVYRIQEYSGRAPQVYMDAWEYGSIRLKISFGLYDAQANSSWSLQDGESVDPFVFTEGNAKAKYFNERVTFEVPLSITEVMIKQSFTSAEEMNAFVSGMFSYIQNSMTIATDELIMKTINNFTAETIYDEYGTNDVSLTSHVKAINLYYLFKQQYPTSDLTADNCMNDAEFIRFAAFTMDVVRERLKIMSKTFNIENEARFTTSEDLRVVCLADFWSAAKVFLQSDTFHNEYTALPKADTVAFWQSSGTTWDEVSSINVTTTEGHTVEQDGIVAVMFDRNALGVSCMNKRTTTQYNGRGEYTNYWFKQDAAYWNDFSENFVVFLVA